MREVHLAKTDIGGAREEIFNLIERDHNNINIYFDGWTSFGAVAVLRSIAQVLPSMKDPPPKLCFGRIIYIDCSSWTSKRVMQKVIAQQLILENEIMAIFDEQDEENDFNGLDLGSTDAIRSVAAVIDNTLRASRFMMIFINGSDEEVVLGTLGIPEYSDCVILWTFSASLVTMNTFEHHDEIKKKLRYADVFLWSFHPMCLARSEFIALFQEEASSIVARYPLIDLYYTVWVEILSEEKIKLMANLMELDIEGVKWPRWISNHLIHKMLPNLQRLRIIKPMYDEAAETETSNIGESFLLTDSTSLEILDLSGSTRVTGSISSKASHLQEITLDGCEGLGDVMLPNNSWLRSFSFDGCGPSEASHWASTIELPPPMSRPNQAPIDANKKKGVVKTSIISLQGCGRLDKLFCVGFPTSWSWTFRDVQSRIISSAACRITTGAILQPAARASNKTMMAGSSSDQQRQHYCLAGGVLMYGDVFTKVVTSQP
ncbi:hypothetical protein HU200_012332 [Digitaria exilis]|uniref:Uncharacterized protein n=1 Tax=Digitaria exilis TaxID=1010633 RepID=A0A835FFU0_9POAL|nr:hypothetical protein HU200_012332 [Digitaria exilis]